MLKSSSLTATLSFHTRYLPGSATKRVCSSLLSAMPLANHKPLATMRVRLDSGSYSRMPSRKALSKLLPIDAIPGRFKPADDLLQFLKSL